MNDIAEIDLIKLSKEIESIRLLTIKVKIATDSIDKLINRFKNINQRIANYLFAGRYHD